MNKYWGFGLRIATDLEFPELLPANFATPDVTICVGKVPESLQHDIVLRKPFSVLSEFEYLLNVKNVCRYYAGYGNSIIAEPENGVDEHSIRLFLLGTVMAAILYQRGAVPMHASAIIKDGGLTLFTGASGSGKSTLLASLATKGYEVFTDDICVLHFDGNNVLGTASYPMIKLWTDTISYFDSPLFNSEFKIRPQLPKYGQFFYDAFVTKPLPIKKIFILSTRNDAETISAEELEPTQKFKAVEKQAYRYLFMVSNTVRAHFFSLGSYIGNNTPVLKVTRPLFGISIEELSAKIESLL